MINVNLKIIKLSKLLLDGKFKSIDQLIENEIFIIFLYSCSSKRLYNAGLVSTSTANNTSPSLSNSDKEDASISTTTKRPTKRRKKAAAAVLNKTSTNSPPKTPLIVAKTELASPVMNTIEESPLIEERSTRSRRTKIPADTIEQTASTTLSATAATATPLIPELVKKVSSPSSSSPTPCPTIAASEKKFTKTTKANNRNSSSSATPQQQILDDFGSPSITTATTNCAASTLTPYWDFTDGRPTRESSPPAKVKYPNPKMSFSDMTKRAKQIMECITKMQSEELKRLPPPIITPSKNNTSSSASSTLLLYDNQQQSNDISDFHRPRSLSTSSSSSSLSSASTVPLLDDYATTATSASSSPSTPIPYHHQQQQQQQQQQQKQQEETSIEILERVGRELTKFQRKFGIVYQHQSVSNNGAGHTKSSAVTK